MDQNEFFSDLRTISSLRVENFEEHETEFAEILARFGYIYADPSASILYRAQAIRAAAMFWENTYDFRQSRIYMEKVIL